GGLDAPPIGAPGARVPEEAVVGSGPNGVYGLERRSERIDDAANFIGVGILGGFVAEIRGNAVVFAGEIGADGLPVLAAIGGLEKKIRGVVHDVRIDGRKEDGLGAIGAEPGVGGGNGRDVLKLA